MSIDEKKFLKYYNMGYTDTSIAKKLGCSQSGVSILRNRLGLSTNYIYREIKNPKNKPCGPQRKYDREEILRGFQLGLSNVSIAEIVGCTPGYVRELRRKEERRKKLRIEGRL